MTPEQFTKILSQRLHYSALTTYKDPSLKMLGLCQDSEEFLLRTGIPTFAEMAWFGYCDDNTLSIFNRCVKFFPCDIKVCLLGGGHEDDSIVCVLSDERVVILNDKMKSLDDVQLLNSSIPQMVEADIAHAEMTAEVMQKYGINEYVLNCVPEDIIADFERKLRAIDPDCLAPKSHWSRVLSLLYSHAEEYTRWPAIYEPKEDTLQKFHLNVHERSNNTKKMCSIELQFTADGWLISSDSISGRCSREGWPFLYEILDTKQITYPLFLCLDMKSLWEYPDWNRQEMLDELVALGEQIDMLNAGVDDNSIREKILEKYILWSEAEVSQN